MKNAKVVRFPSREVEPVEVPDNSEPINLFSVEGMTAPPPEMTWLLPGFIPMGEVTLLSGDGGVGKSTLALQIALHASIGLPVLGIQTFDVEQIPTVFLGFEDDEDQIRRRVWALCRAGNIDLREFETFRAIGRTDRDPTIARTDADGIVRLTTFWGQALDEIDDFLRQHEPWYEDGPYPRGGDGFIVIDTASVVFDGNESARREVTQFIGHLSRFARRHNVTILLVGHVSKSAIATGAGYSGSTAWNNAVRARLLLEKPRNDDGGAADKTARTLTVAKSNYGPDGISLALRIVDGAFRLDMPQTGEDGDDATKSRLLAFIVKRWDSQRPLSPHPNSAAYAPRVAMRELGIPRRQLRDLERALSALIDEGKIAVESLGPASKRRDVLRSVPPQ
jgi:DNA repair protein RadA/Sms